MPDIRTNPALYADFKRALAELEGNRVHFYLDSVGLVTIGIGRLVEHVGVGSQQEVTRLLNIIGQNSFRTQTGAVATAIQVEGDWTDVNNGGHSTLSISQARVNRLLDYTLNIYCNALFEAKPFVRDLHQRIQMAIIDTRFNPSGVILYGDQLNNHFWPFLDPLDSNYDLQRGLDYFRGLWPGADGQYIERVALRVLWFQQAIDETLRNPICTE